VIYVGIDDTDTPDTPGTNQLARALIARVAGAYQAVLLVRHQLLYDPRIPYTSKNGSASILLRPRGPARRPELLRDLRAGMRAWFKPGSDPGLCVAETVPDPVRVFGRRCQTEVVDQEEARRLAAACGLHLEGLGGTEGGVIGALAAVGLVAGGNDGRVVQLGEWPDDLSGPQDLRAVQERGIDLRCLGSEAPVTGGTVDVGKHLRPNYRGGRVVLYVTPAAPEAAHTARWQAVRLP
jgi:hypothetical protein